MSLINSLHTAQWQLQGSHTPKSASLPHTLVSSLLAGGSLHQRYAATLLHSLGSSCSSEALPVPQTAALDGDAARDWAESGLMALTGEKQGPPQRADHAIPSCAKGAISALENLAGHSLPASFESGALLVERSRILGLSRQGRISPGGSCRLIAGTDGMLALNLARQEDWRLLPAWLEEGFATSTWETLEEKISSRAVEALVSRGRMLGLPVAAATSTAGKKIPWYRFSPTACSVERPSINNAPLVIDLSGLWAGPLCTQLLLQIGARVIKVESEHRPDAMRTGTAEFYELVNAGKESVQLDFQSAAGRETLLALLHAADIVVESSRPRALEQMGIQAQAIVDQHPSKVWLSLTGYGRVESKSNWVAFGDDAGAAAGLSLCDEDDKTPTAFCGDAIADPLTGMHAAVAALAFWQRGQGGLVDINLCDVASYCLAFHKSQNIGKVTWDIVAQAWCLEDGEQRFLLHQPTLRKTTLPTAALGENTDAVLLEFAAC
ncbi:MAG: hypothetical protein ACI9JM_002246 [Halioglobus sp.]|jgi:hypothetical protein